MSGEVLWGSRHVRAATWREIDGVLQLEAFTGGPGERFLAISGSGWGLDTKEAQRLEASMESALARWGHVLEAAKVAGR